jgi:magnesium transporter
MITLHDGTANYNNKALNLAGGALPPDVKWIDVFEGAPEEIAYVERIIGRSLPTLAELSEVESSSRLQFEDNVFYLSTPLVARNPQELPATTPVGFVLTKDVLVTIRFARLSAFISFAEVYARQTSTFVGAQGVFIGLMDAIIDRAADVLEEVGGELDRVSQNVFINNTTAASLAKSPVQQVVGLRELVRKIGYNGDLSSKIRISLMGIGRILSYVSSMGGTWLSPEQTVSLTTQRQDIISLSDYDAHLMNNVQFLLDATIGLISIEQSNIVKVLTVVSVVGVPPTLIASIYGMNFHAMPELSWSFGYPFGLALILLSAIVPLVWFRKRGWM